MFKYGISIDGDVVAKFTNSVDRDDCLDHLTQTNEDCDVQPVELDE